jgi:hypothetical protein
VLVNWFSHDQFKHIYLFSTLKKVYLFSMVTHLALYFLIVKFAVMLNLDTTSDFCHFTFPTSKKN